MFLPLPSLQLLAVIGVTEVVLAVLLYSRWRVNQQEIEDQSTTNLKRELTAVRKEIVATAQGVATSLQTWQQSVQTDLKEQLTKTVHAQAETTAKQLKQSITDSAQVLETEIKQIIPELHTELKNQVATALKAALQEITAFKQSEITKVEAAGTQAANKVAAKLLGSSLTQKQQHQLAEKMLEEALAMDESA